MPERIDIELAEHLHYEDHERRKLTGIVFVKCPICYEYFVDGSIYHPLQSELEYGEIEEGICKQCESEEE